MITNGNRPRALITGASAGIGEGFARHLARRGHDLSLVARRKERLDTLASELSSSHGVSVDTLAADLSTEEGTRAIEETLASHEVDLLVNNAGFGTYGDFAELPLERELEEVDLNVRALFRLTHAGLRSMIPRKRGGIINVASMAAFQPIPHNATYSATKAFVLHFSEAVHEEAKEHGVTVTCLCPGPVRTEFQQVAGLDTSTVPSMAWETVDSVVESALAALKAGNAIAIPGPINMMLAGTTKLAPRFVVRRMAGSFMRGRRMGPV
jgi:short-subunit dehydrogenase